MQVIRELCPEAVLHDVPLPSTPAATALPAPASTSSAPPTKPQAAQKPDVAAEQDPEDSVPLESLPPALPKDSELPTGSPEALVHRLAAVRQRAQRSGLIGGNSQATPQNTFQPFSPPADTMAVRLTLLLDWIIDQFNAQHACLADPHGESLTEISLPEGFAAAAALHAEALHRSFVDARFEASNAVHSALDNGQVLTVISAPTQEGLFSIALLRTAPLSRRDVVRCRDGFYSAIDAQMDQPRA